jgi:hypothetical protein
VKELLVSLVSQDELSGAEKHFTTRSLLCGESFCHWVFFRLSEATEHVFCHPLEIISCFSVFSISIEETLSMHYRAV